MEKRAIIYSISICIFLILANGCAGVDLSKKIIIDDYSLLEQKRCFSRFWKEADFKLDDHRTFFIETVSADPKVQNVFVAGVKAALERSKLKSTTKGEADLTVKIAVVDYKDNSPGAQMVAAWLLFFNWGIGNAYIDAEVVIIANSTGKEVVKVRHKQTGLNLFRATKGYAECFEETLKST